MFSGKFRGNEMVKIFIGNLSPETEKDEVEALFVQYGTVTECAKYKNYAFVHMEDRKSATKAIRELHLHKLNGRPINVELSRGKGHQGPVKIHIANVEKGFDKELRELFEEYGTVSECAIVKNFAFVHMPNSEEAMDAIQGLDNSEFQGENLLFKMAFLLVFNLFSLLHFVSSQESAYMFRYLKVGPEGDQRRRNILHLHLAEEAITHLPIQWRGPSLPIGAACLLTLLRLRCRLRQDGQGILTAVMANGMATGWSITMRDSEPVHMARWATTTGAPSPPLRRHHPRPWLESASVCQPMTPTNGARSRRHLLQPP